MNLITHVEGESELLNAPTIASVRVTDTSAAWYLTLRDEVQRLHKLHPGLNELSFFDASAHWLNLPLDGVAEDEFVMAQDELPEALKKALQDHNHDQVIRTSYDLVKVDQKHFWFSSQVKHTDVDVNTPFIHWCNLFPVGRETFNTPFIHWCNLFPVGRETFVALQEHFGGYKENIDEWWETWMEQATRYLLVERLGDGQDYSCVPVADSHAIQEKARDAYFGEDYGWNYWRCIDLLKLMTVGGTHAYGIDGLETLDTSDIRLMRALRQVAPYKVEWPEELEEEA
jgi:hypothetical protein